MSDTSRFEIDLLAEKHAVIAKLNNLNSIILNDMTYIDSKIRLSYYGQVDLIIQSIGHEYDNVRNRKEIK